MGKSDFIWNEFVYGGHWLSIGAAAIVFSAMLVFNYTIRWEFLLIIYLITQCSYNYNHFKELNIDISSDSPRAVHLKSYIRIMPYIIFFYGVAYVLLLLVYGDPLSIYFGLLLLAISLFFTYKGKKIFSRLMGFKSFYAALTWAFLIPFTALYISYSINLTTFLFSLFVFLRLVLNINFFDIKDIISDSQENVRTFVIGLGKEKFLHLLHILNVISFIPIIIGVLLNVLPVSTIALLLLSIYSFHCIQRVKKDSHDIHNISFVLVDGELIFWPVLIFIGMVIFTV